MEFLRKLFGRRQEQNQHSFTLPELEKYLAEQLSSEQKQLEKSISTKFSSIRSEIATLQKKLQQLAANQLNLDEGDKRLRQVVKTSKDTFLNRLKPLLAKIQPPQLATADSIADYCSKTPDIFVSEIVSMRKNIAYTSILIKEDLKDIGVSTAAIQELLLSARKAYHESRFHAIKGLQSMISGRHAAEADISAVQQAIEQKTSEFDSLQAEIEASQKRLDSAQKSSAYAAYQQLLQKQTELSAKKQQLKGKAINLLSELERPLKKLQKISESEPVGLTGEQSKLLSRYLSDTFLALHEDPKGQQLKQILQVLQQSIYSGRIKLEEKERQKKLSAIESLLARDLFDEFFWQFNSIDKELSAIEKQLSSSTAISDIQKHSSELDSLRRSKAELLFELERLKASLAKKRQNISKLQETLADSLKEKLGKNFSLST